MLKRMHGIAATALCAVSFALLAAPHAQAAGTEIARAEVTGKPWVLVWVDTKDGTGIDNKAAQSFQTLFAGTVWSITDDNRIAVTKDGKGLLQLLYPSWEDQSAFPFHARAQRAFVDGVLFRYPSEPDKGHADVYITELGTDGTSSRTIHLQVALAFAGGGTNEGNGEIDWGF
jgi:hypothetical protein